MDPIIHRADGRVHVPASQASPQALRVDPLATYSPNEVGIDGHLLRFDFRSRRILEDRGGSFAEIARLEPRYPGLDHIKEWQGVIHFPAHTLTLRRFLLRAPAGRLESRASGTTVNFKLPWISKQLHVEGAGSFENTNRYTVMGRYGDESAREVCAVIAALWVTAIFYNDSSG